MEPLVNVLRLQPEDIIKDETSILENYERWINRVQTHDCSFNYCLREVTKKKDKSKSDNEEDPILESGQQIKNGKIYECRFGYPADLAGYSAKFVNVEEAQVFDQVSRLYSSTDPRSPTVMEKGAEIVVESGSTKKLVYLRNHPMVNNHIKELGLGWNANIDSKVILHHDQLEEYIMKYILKEEKHLYK